MISRGESRIGESRIGEAHFDDLRSSSATPAQTMGAIAAAALVLALPALWNGFPFLFWDTVDYLEMPFTGIIPPYRTASYVLAMLPGVLTGTVWAVVALQCLLTAFVLHEALDAFAPGKPSRTLVPATAALTVSTALPWYAGQLMADAFTGLVVLGMAVLMFGPDRGPARRLGVAAVVALGIGVHTSHLAVAAGLVAMALPLWGLCRVVTRLGWLRPRVGTASLALGVGVLLVGVANWAVSGQFHLTQSNANLMFARLLQDGIAHEYLAEVCPTNPNGLRLCAVRDRLPHNANAYLWYPGPFSELGGWENDALRDEAAFIVRDSVRRLPLRHIGAAIDLTWRQLWMIRSGDGLLGLDTVYKGEPTRVKSMFMPRYLADYYPGDLDAYWDSRQRYDINMGAFNQLHAPLAAMATIGISIVLFYGLSGRDRRAAGLAFVVGLALLGNAFVCGALSNPLDRYQARLVWVAVFAVGAVTARNMATSSATRREEAVATA